MTTKLPCVINTITDSENKRVKHKVNRRVAVLANMLAVQDEGEQITITTPLINLTHRLHMNTKELLTAKRLLSHHRHQTEDE